MTRKQFIDRFISILTRRTGCSELEIEEFRLMLELMPDKDIDQGDKPTLTTNPDFVQFPKDIEWWTRPQTLMYGAPYPNTTYSTSYSTNPPTNSSSSTTYTSTSTLDDLKQEPDEKLDSSSSSFSDLPPL